ncbi:ubiquitin ligase complex F-box protein [Polychaeton citri CBS 116435]|uniref:Ubiquitin ligase complex F-box protein n=1 Tax=Polychaeton citri CBS 116435 TaxID=1314669 RepID=A0A9P4Q214_9PEZI|nr:ubiquitin ligase complex F-box protein [Polychaeton citri CBS 116435]
MARSRGRHQRISSGSSSSSTSPERGDDDGDSFMLQPNDSESSLGMDISSPDLSQTEASRREYEEMCKASPVHRLPAELLISIFSRLSAPKDLQTCMLVSKEWAKNSVGLLWHRPAMSKWESIHSVVQSLRKTDKQFAYQDLVKRLNMSTLAAQVSDGTLIGMQDCKRIERLTLTNCAKLTDLSLQPLIESNRSLLALDITALDQVTDKTLVTVADNCLRLQGLNVTGCKRLTDASIVAIAKNCRHLKRLKFNNCLQVTDSSIMTVAAHSTHLLEIDLYGLQNLESPAVTALLTACRHLRELRLAHCSRITDAAFLDVPQDPDFPVTFDALRILDLTDCNELGDKAVERIIATCPRLRNLILAKCRQLTDRSVFAITKLGKNLHYIHLGHCARITDGSVEALAKSCTRIRYIDLACCSNLTDGSVMKLAGLPKLKRIGLVKCAGITDHSIYALAMGEMRNGRRVNGVSVLERVHLSYCTLLTIEGIHVLLNNCPKLTHLSLTGVQAFLRDELLAFCREAPPEFNDHQRDVFCVFSGTGVTRLRDYLNDQKARQDARASGTPSLLGSGSDLGIDDDIDDNNPETDGNNTPVINVNINSQFPPGMTPISGPSSGVLFANALSSAFQWQPLHAQHPPSIVAAGSVANLSQSAPASSGIWHHAGPGGITTAPPPPPPQHNFQHHTVIGPAGGGAQHVTGMMGATILDDVDEGDEAFGEGSEIMGD